jgi:curved DNA-binding protein
VPEASQPGLKLRLRGMGLPALGEKGTAGDLYVVVDVALPRSLDDDTRRLYEQLAKLDAPDKAKGEGS